MEKLEIMKSLDEIESLLRNYRGENLYTQQILNFENIILEMPSLSQEEDAHFRKLIDVCLSHLNMSRHILKSDDLAKLHFILGRLNFLLNNQEDARTHFNEAGRNGMNQVIVSYHTAMSYAADIGLGKEERKKLAVDSLQRVIDAAGPESRPGLEARAHITLMKKKSGCFIATAVYGSPAAEEVLVFRRFRDQVMLASRQGRKLVDLYYLISPRLASLISKYKWLQSITRWLLLDPILHLIRDRR